MLLCEWKSLASFHHILVVGQYSSSATVLKLLLCLLQRIVFMPQVAACSMLEWEKLKLGRCHQAVTQSVLNHRLKAG
jgi:hypothetical protein